MRTWFLVLALVAVGGGCKKKTESSAASGVKPPASTTEQDALWALAPDGAVIGVVISPQGVGRIQNGLLDIKTLLDTAPDLAPFKAKVDEALNGALGTTDVSLATAGLSPAKGFALFAVDQNPPIVILPVGDRDKFLTVVHGTKGATAADPDTIKKATCKTIKNVYACARDVTLFDRLGKGSMKDQLALAGARGDLELAASLPTKHPITFAAVAQLDRGTIVLRGAVKGVPKESQSFLVNVKPRVEKDKTSGFLVVNARPIAQQLGGTVPHQELLAGVFLDDVVKSIDGALTVTIPNASHDIDARLPVTDPAPWQKMIDQCTTIPPLQAFGATVQSGTCHVPVPQMSTSVDLWTDNKELRIGNKTPKAGVVTPLSAAGQELAAGDWVFALYGHGTLLTGDLPAMGEQTLPPDAMLGIRALTLITELGFGMKAESETVRFVVTVRTIWANPEDVTKKLLAISPSDVMAGNAGAASRAIVAGAPTSPFAADFAAGYTGLMIPAMAIGMLAAIAVPAFSSYMQHAQGRDRPDPPTNVTP